MNRVVLHRIELHATESLIPASVLSLAFSDTGPCVVLGENGSGKSLIAASILAAIDADGTKELLRDLAQAGLREIKLTLCRGSEWMDLIVNVSDGTRTVHPHNNDSKERESNGSVPGSKSDEILSECGDLFSKLHCVLNGEIREPDTVCLSRIAEAMRRPLQREIDSWNHRLKLLTGEDGNSGELLEQQTVYDHSKRDWERVKSLLAEIESVKARKGERNSQLTELITSGAVLKVERDEIERTVGLAERAARVENWLAEVHRDIVKVEALRDEHQETQEALDKLAGKFRGVPDHFPELLDEYEKLSGLRNRNQSVWNDLEAKRSALQDEILDVERDLNSLKAPQTEGIQSRIDELYREIQADETILVDLLRDRISLLRKREGLGQRLHSEFAQIGLLDRPALDSVRRICSDTTHSIHKPGTKPHSAEDLRLIRKRHDDLNHQLQSDFQGLELLTEHAEEELRDLNKTRSVISESSDLLESLQARKADALTVGRGPHWIAAIVAIAAIVGVPAGIFLGWDIGLFGALASSGLVWLMYRSTHKAAEKRVLELTQHENNVRQRWKSAVETRTMLEQRLGPLANLKDEEALNRLAVYQSMTHERTQLSDSLAKVEKQLTESEDKQTAGELPPCFSRMKPDQILSQLQDFEELQAEKKVLDRAWTAFESGGETAVQIEQLEIRISRRKGEVEALQSSQADEARSYTSRKQTLANRLKELRSKLPEDERIDTIAREMSELETGLAKLAEASGQLLADVSAQELKDEWNRFCDLKQQQRSLKNELSACLSLDEIRSRKSILTDELHEVKERLSELDTLYLVQGSAADNAKKYRGQLESVSEQIAANLIQIEKVRQELEELDRGSSQKELHSLPTLETLESDLENYEQSLEKTKREIRTTQELLESLEREIRKVEPELPAQIEASANKMIENYFGHEFGAVYYQEPEWRVRVKPNQERSLHSLSRGQADLLRLIIRIASLEMLDSVENDFVVWDDVLGNLDDARLRNMRNLIDAFAGKRQVILFSRDNRLAQKSEAILLRPEGDFKSTY